MADSTKTDNITLLDAGSYQWNWKTHYWSVTDEHIPEVVNLEYEHQLVHEGKLFQLSGRISGLGVGATTYLHGLTDSATIHFRAADIVTDGAPADVIFYEDPDITANGTEIFGKNKNRNISNTHTLRVFTGPTIGGGGTGTALEYGFVVVAGPGQAGSSASLFASEWILDNTSSYLVAITNNDSQAMDINYNFLWYEN